METRNPVLVHVTRGNALESLHRGAAAVVDAGGTVIAAWGDVEAAVIPRSAIKPIQALALVESGAADHFGLGGKEIALACSSHNAEPGHIQRVADWLRRLGLSADDLECGPHLPMDLPSAKAMIRAGEEPTAIHNNCSGKHTGFLTTALHLGEPTRGYTGDDHPAQIRWRQTLSELAGVDLTDAPRGTDGCGIPTLALPLSALARAMARLAGPNGADPEALSPARADAARRITAAMTSHPYLVAGRDRIDTAIMEIGGGIVTKGGAEGVHIAILPGKGWGVAIKMDDGAKRAADTAMTALLGHLGVLDPAGVKALAPYREQSVTNAVGKTVGVVRPAPGWPNS